MILCIGTTPAAQRVMVFTSLTPNAVNRAITTIDGAAGKVTNVAKVLKALGEKPLAVTFLGGPRGAELADLLHARGIEFEAVTVDAPTRQCVTLIDRAGRVVTELVEESRPVPETAAVQLIEIIRRRGCEARAFVMSGSLAPGVPVDFYPDCTLLARDAGALAVVDAQGTALIAALAARPELVKPNRQELAATAGRPLRELSDVCAAARDLSEKGARQVVVTAGAEPTVAFDGKSFWRVDPPRIETVNPFGSGDAFTAALTQALVRGDDLAEACRHGAAAGAANALELMAGELDPETARRLAASVVIERLR